MVSISVSVKPPYSIHTILSEGMPTGPALVTVDLPVRARPRPLLGRVSIPIAPGGLVSVPMAPGGLVSVPMAPCGLVSIPMVPGGLLSVVMIPGGLESNPGINEGLGAPEVEMAKFGIASQTPGCLVSLAPAGAGPSRISKWGLLCMILVKSIVSVECKEALVGRTEPSDGKRKGEDEAKGVSQDVKLETSCIKSARTVSSELSANC